MNLDFETQHKYYLDYNIKAVELGVMCNQYPALQKAWEQFKTDPGAKKEFFDNIKLQQEFAPR